ncbi:MAG: hypothetical protein ACFFA5_01825 [Promethearchaeota archaeon]
MYDCITTHGRAVKGDGLENKSFSGRSSRSINNNADERPIDVGLRGFEKINE